MTSRFKFGSSWPSQLEVEMDALESKGIICGPCSREGGNYCVATNYCMDCGENLCKPCAESHKIKNKTRGHKVLLKTKGEAKVQHLPESFARCLQHPAKVLEMYCQAHDCVVCSECIKTEHKQCPAIRHVPEIAKGVRRTTEQSQACNRLGSLKDQYLTLKREWGYNLKSLAKQRDEVLRSIADTRRTISFALDKLEKETKESLQLLFNTECRKIETEIRSCALAMSGLEKLSHKLGNVAKTKNETKIFVDVKNANKSMSEFEETYKELVVKQKEPQIQFKIFDPVKEFPSLEAFGKLSLAYCGEAGTDYNVRITGDRKTCDISGLVFLDDGRLVVTDRANNRLKILDAHYNCTHHCNLPGQPYDVCKVGTNELAISFASLTKIQFISVDSNGITPTRSFETLETKCLGIAFNGQDLYAVCWKEKPSLRCYSLQGRLKMVTELSKTGEDMFTDPRRVIADETGTKLHVTDAKKGVMTLNNSGDVINTFTDPKLLTPVGITFIPSGGVYVSGFDSHTVIEIDGEGKKKGTILTALDGLKNPKYLNFDWSRKRLIVTLGDSDKIKVWLSF